jgi:hypothetical protein
MCFNNTLPVNEQLSTNYNPLKKTNLTHNTFSKALDCHSTVDAFSFILWFSPSYGNNFHYNIFQHNFLIKSNSNLMKNMMFIFRGLVKVSMLLVLMVSAQSIVAQSFSSQADAFTSSTSKNAVTVSNASYTTSPEAITSLNTEVLTLRDNAPNVTTPAGKFATEVKMAYFRHIGGLINTGSSVQGAMTQSTSFLNNLFAKADNTYGLLQADIFQEALDLVSN